MKTEFGHLTPRDIGDVVVVRHGDVQTMGKLVGFSHNWSEAGLEVRVNVGNVHLGPFDPWTELEIEHR